MKLIKEMEIYRKWKFLSGNLKVIFELERKYKLFIYK
jgi:hypothetical protein